MDDKPNPPPSLSSHAKEFVPSRNVDAQLHHDLGPAGQADTYLPLPAGRVHYPNPYGGWYIGDDNSTYEQYYASGQLPYMSLPMNNLEQDLQQQHQHDHAHWLQQLLLQQQLLRQHDYARWLEQQEHDGAHLPFQQQQQPHFRQRQQQQPHFRQRQQQQPHFRQRQQQQPHFRQRQQQAFRGGDDRQQREEQRQQESPSDSAAQADSASLPHEIQPTSSRRSSRLPLSPQQSEQHQDQEMTEERQQESPSDSAAQADSASLPHQIQTTSSRSCSRLPSSLQQSEQHQDQEVTERQEEAMPEDGQEHDMGGFYTIEMTLPPHIEETNLLYMFNKQGKDIWKHGKEAQVQFSCYTDALQAQSTWAVNEKLKRAHLTNFRMHEFMKPYGEMEPRRGPMKPKRQREEEGGMSSSQTETAKASSSQTETAKASSSQEEKTKMKRLKRECLQEDHFKWCTLEEFSKEAPEHELVRPFNFTTAAKEGSVSSEITLCVAGPMCHHTFMSLLMHAFSTHLSKKTWKGRIKRRDLCISKTMQLCAILRKTVPLTNDEDMISDILSIISSSEPLYTVNGFWPPYYNEMLSKLQDPPSRTNPKDLEGFHRNVLKRPAFSTPELRSHTLQEFYSNTFEFEIHDWVTFNRSAPMELEDWLHITRTDSVLTRVKDESYGMGPQFGRQSRYMRHLVVHAPEDKEKRRLRLMMKEKDKEKMRLSLMMKEKDKEKMEVCDDEDHGLHDSDVSDDEESELDDEKKERLQGVAPAAPLGDDWPPLTKAPAPLAAPASAQADVSALACPRPPKPTRKAHAPLAASASAQRDVLASPGAHTRKPTKTALNICAFVAEAFKERGISDSPTPPPPPPTITTVSWDITEKDMLGHYYFKVFMPTFVDHMYKERGNQKFLGKICSSYENGLPKLGCIPHEMIPDEYLEELEEEDSWPEEGQEMEEGQVWRRDRQQIPLTAVCP
ncbi:uncharacterized protein LOC119362201 [Triticum dicoccoides]|uniref:uncharacterized protein LOC119362201 n=1 Tax=Triticum dicoccoides TaxID=85692 RepID=UPI00188EC4F5|nr:uncharacterized protein LOC119362201 [Triticum dicoccoides]